MRNIFICLALAALSSCTIQRRIYSPTEINNPSLRQKNDHSFTLAYSGPSGFDFTGGYAITDRLAIIGGAYTYRNNDNQSDNSIFSNYTASSQLLYKHKGFHGGLGFYFPLSKHEKNSYASFFTGYTKGNFHMDDHYIENYSSGGTGGSTTVNDYFYKSNIGRYFLQGAFNAYMNRFEVAVSARYNYVTYSNATTNYTANEQFDYSLPPNGYSKNSQFLDIGFDARYFFTDSRKFGMMLFGEGTTRLARKEFNYYYYGYRFGIGVVVKNPFQKK